MSIAGNSLNEAQSARSGSEAEDRQDRDHRTDRRAPATRLAPLVAAARAPVVAVLGWLVLLVPAYWSLVDGNGQWLFKLDSFVYYEAVRQWHEGGDLYSWYANPPQHLWPFTYTPLAAWVITPLTWMSYQSATVLLMVATPLCAAVTVYAVLRQLRVRVRTAHGLAPWLALVGVVVLEPLPKTMEYAQVNAILMALVAVDLLVVPTRSRWRGVLSGLAAAIKLTPAVAILVLLARREWRAASTMAGSAVGLTVLAGLMAPAETWEFFTSAMWDPGRAGFADYSGNQNLKGAIARALPESAWNPTWAACSLLTVVAAWFLCRRLDRLRGSGSTTDDGVAGTADSAHAAEAGLVLSLQVSVVMVLGLLISPISWSHHWVWCLPALMSVGAASWRWRSTALGVAGVAGVLVFVLAMQWWFPEQNHVEQGWPAWAKVVGSSYTWWALGCGATLWWASGRRLAALSGRVSG
ncbi:glycosyltransferase 87 family protein [Actinomyces sp. ZJ308]|uniref:glycosyltransferase 87 family protein n=1 Tax=Actinomyces sp. ZJ308 TaxID=2708342 RepID=UPI001420DAE8|nr:glycosyltransferase 87 family protein [Actinomyces sp. ZJ308]